MRLKKIQKQKKAQVWVETVIYTLIGLAVIGILLVVTKPKIDSIKDKLAIEQSISVLDEINNKINEVKVAQGNKRVVTLKITKGKFVIDSENDKLYWIIDSKHKYSEPGVSVSIGKDFNVLTTEASPWDVRLEITLTSDLRYNGEDVGTKELEAASTPYSLHL